MPRRTDPFRQFGTRLEPRGGGFDAPAGAGPAGERALTVSALSLRITQALDQIGPVFVRGELRQAKVHGSGHFYATLSDGEASISLVMWRSTVQRHGRLPGEGEQVEVRGEITTYAPRGQYQITATRISPVGAGDLAVRFEALKQRLRDEGLFAEERKRPLPFLPRGIGIATAAGSAALADLLHSITARFPGMPVVHVPCQVQGEGAAASIVAALEALGRRDDIDVVICGRGGGSLEDLWAFNEEAVVRAIAACPLPVISAVGHETDTTLADYVADLRAKTPTAAGEIVVPDREALDDRLDDLEERIDAGIDALLEDADLRLAAYAAHRALTGPRYQIELRSQRLDELAGRLGTGAEALVADARTRFAAASSGLRSLRPTTRLAHAAERLRERQARLHRAVVVGTQRGEERIASLAGRLQALSPLAVLARGYAVVRAEDGRLVRRTADVRPGEQISARVADGWVDATVDRVRNQRLGEAGDLYDATEESR